MMTGCFGDISPPLMTAVILLLKGNLVFWELCLYSMVISSIRTCVNIVSGSILEAAPTFLTTI